MDRLQIAGPRGHAGVGQWRTTDQDGSVLDPRPLHAGRVDAVPDIWSAEDELILQTISSASGDIVATRVAREGDLKDVVVTPANEFDAARSPNGRWLAFVSDRTGANEIWVKAYPEGVPVRVSRETGYEPRWSADGRELFYLQGNAMMAVPVKTEAEFSFAATVQLFNGPYFTVADRFVDSYDVARDGRFVMIQQSENATDATGSASIVVVQNWFEDLKRLVPTK